MKGITHRRARNEDSEIIKKILKKTFVEYGIQLPDGYSFADVDNLEEEYLIASGEFLVLIGEQRIIGFFALLPSGTNQVELKRLYLKADERGKGLGEFLLKLALAGSVLPCREFRSGYFYPYKIVADEISGSLKDGTSGFTAILKATDKIDK